MSHTHDKFPEPLPVGTKVRKTSGKPFKSRLKVNTISEVGDMFINGCPTYRFNEDDSYVECWRCEEVV